VSAEKNMSSCNKKKSKFPVAKDVVLLHQLDRGIFTPSISPFPLKLETYMRMAGISYEVQNLIHLLIFFKIKFDSLIRWKFRTISKIQ
jgi:hypothetical protein